MNIIKNSLLITSVLLGLFILQACDSGAKKQKESKQSLQLLDEKATVETKALYANLWKLRTEGTIIGHHESLLYGRYWDNESGRSDVKDVTGDFPGVCSLDFAKIEHGDDKGINGSKFSDMRRVTKEAYARGEVITYCWHADNPLTGGNSWDNSSSDVLKEILKKGSTTNVLYLQWLDNLAAFANTLVDENEKAIPIIFRPFHEQTQEWNWWGKKCATEEEFVGLWKLTIEYLRDTKNIHHFIYAISPQMDFIQPKEDILYRWPGDDYVDIIGMDCYHGANAAAFKHNLKNISKIAEQKIKPFAVTETGLEGLMNNGEVYNDYWTKEMLAPLTETPASFVIFWRNEYDPKESRTHYFGIYKSHESVNDFMKLYNSENMLFSADLPNMYKQVQNIEVK